MTKVNGSGQKELKNRRQTSSFFTFLASIMSKRPTSESAALIKRQRTDETDPTLQQLVVAAPDAQGAKGALIQTVRRTSGLNAPIMCLRGHSAEVLDLKFSPDGQTLASASADKTILLWRVYGDCQNHGILRMSKGAATCIAFTSNSHLVAGSSDHTLFLFDLKSGEVERRFRGHHGVINAVDVQRGGMGRGLIASASDDGTVRVWSEAAKDEIEVIELGYPITAVKWSEDGQSLYIGGLDNDVHVFSLSSHSVTYSLRSHADTVTSLSLSPNSQQLLSVGADSVLNLWNVQPFAPTVNTTNPTLHPRLLRSFYGAPSGFEGLLRKASWSRHETATTPGGGTMVAVGGADRALTVWDATTGEIRYKLPGHTGTVISTDWSPKEPILASGGVEGAIYLGEVEAV
ncbi:WD40 repeat domain-containing protein [Sporobolomyces salmoneus]|uniref:WD40 repeat domain-containing protein n=1 Tax=Sporobolomyces salmoneus TaxID=183962 RepID=UPI003181D7FD